MKKIIYCFLALLAGRAVWAAPIPSATYAKRRAAVMDKMSGEGMLILFSAPPRKFTGDMYYKFRQENNLYYLTGIAQEDTILVLMPGNKSRRENLFLLNRDPSREVWTGNRLSVEEAKQLSGIDSVYGRAEFDDFINALLSGASYGVNRYTNPDEYARFFFQLKGSAAPVFLLLEDRPGLNGRLSPEFEFSARLRERFPGIVVRDSTDLFAALRLAKQPEELERIRRAVDITADGLTAAARQVHDGVKEYELQATVEFHYLKNGASPGFPSIIGSGENGTTLHYDENSRQADLADLIVVDVGAEFDYYSADITRTLPVGGKFSPAQAAVYQLVLEAQEEGMKLLRPGATIPQVHQRVTEVIKAGLLKLGLITDADGDQYRSFFMHGTSHWLGMDVHDVGERSAPFQPGMVLTVEPGIYVRRDLLDNLGQDSKNREWIEKMRPAFERYVGIGVRIEDDFLITADGYEQLSRRLPRKMEEVERWMKSP